MRIRGWVVVVSVGAAIASVAALAAGITVSDEGAWVLAGIIAAPVLCALLPAAEGE